jgi:hypothetical protein
LTVLTADGVPHFSTTADPPDHVEFNAPPASHSGDGTGVLGGHVHGEVTEIHIDGDDGVTTGSFALVGPPIDLKSYPEAGESNGDPVTLNLFLTDQLWTNALVGNWPHEFIPEHIQFEAHVRELSTQEDHLIDQQDLVWQGGDNQLVYNNLNFQMQSYIGDVIEFNFIQFQASFAAELHYFQGEGYRETSVMDFNYGVSFASSPRPPAPPRAAPPSGAPVATPVPQSLAADVLARNDASFAPRPPQAQQPFGGTALDASSQDRLSQTLAEDAHGPATGADDHSASQTAPQWDDLSAVAGMPARDGDLAVG